MRVKIHLNKLLLKQKFSISHGQYDHRNNLIIELQEGDFQGFGETVAIDYYQVTIEHLSTMALSVASLVEKLECKATPTEFYKKLEAFLPSDPFLRSAFDQAYWDLYTRMQGSSIRQLAGIQQEENTNSSITIGLTDSMASIKLKLANDWPIFKIKYSAEAKEDTIKLIAEAGRSFGIDANGGLNLGQAQSIVNLVHQLDGSYVEQLVDKTFRNQLTGISIPKGLPHLADEAITSLKEAKEISKFYDGFVLKSIKCGGLTPVLEIIDFAKKEGKLLLAGCMTESSIGINHMLELLPLFDFADLDGAYLISNDREVTSLDSKAKRQLQENGKFTTLA